MPISGPALAALSSLTPAQISFLQSIPKAELHAHLNGSIPIQILQELASEYLSSTSARSIPDSAVQESIQLLTTGPALDKIDDFFLLFPAIYALTSTPDALQRVTRAVLHDFFDGDYPQCTYLELRTTPRSTSSMDREQYLLTVLDEVEKYSPEQTGLVVSLDRRMSAEVMDECVEIAVRLRSRGRRVLGVDLCGDPTAGNVQAFEDAFRRAKEGGLGVTMHIAETTNNTPEETLQLLSYCPERLGHATFLNDEAISIVLEKKMCIEICLTSNLLCKTVPTLEAHHIKQYLNSNHPISICTDDTLPFRTSLLAEYALLLAIPPLGLGLSEDQVRRIGEMSLQARFR
ncbi:hypothetical protein M413DRAFT_447147 [Hebeloma cylindrosporum]|uniref:Adenosine deaminase domain-containing protein n=1 Tax=Hebeloma cylindrosporum TaxID=76867 RepID=A0A0C2XNF1_HEBCY|nr:hypothetical protein M413DRAFT_447147 [Hebeloma cylindrosporum h7]